MLDIVYVHGHRAERAYITGTFSWFLCFTSYAFTFMWFFFHMESGATVRILSGKMFQAILLCKSTDVKFCQQPLYYIFWSHIPKPCIFHVHTIDWTQMKITIIMFFFLQFFLSLFSIFSRFAVGMHICITIHDIVPFWFTSG